MSLAALVGRFVGAVLAECGPVLVEILRSAFKDTVEDSRPSGALVERLRARLRHPNDLRERRGSGSSEADPS